MSSTRPAPHNGLESSAARSARAPNPPVRAASSTVRSTSRHEQGIAHSTTVNQSHEEPQPRYMTGALANLYRQRGTILAQAMADRQEWDHATAGSRRLAIAADAELRRRHPDQKIGPPRSRR